MKNAAEADDELERPTSVYARIREDIIEGRIPAQSRLKVRDLAARYEVSTNPVREALQQLRGEGFVVIEPNRGARVRTIDAAFLTNTNEIELLVEPYLTRWFADVVTQAEIDRMEAIQHEIEALNFADPVQTAILDTSFHGVIYKRHPNELILELWSKHREILGAVTKRFPIALSRQTEVVEEHRSLIECLKRHDADGAERIMMKHVNGSSRHMMHQMRSNGRR